MHFAKGVILASTFLAFFSRGILAVGSASAQGISSIQLVGNFNGITCEPNDPANSMDLIDDHVWRKLKFVDDPMVPDTIFFKFTQDGSYLPKHWGWSGIWGIAAFEWSPPSIAAILPDSGYYYFYFKDTDYTYWIDRPMGSIFGTVKGEKHVGVPEGAHVTLYDSENNVIGTFCNFADSTYRFSPLCESVYRLTAQAPGFRDTTISGITLAPGEAKDLPIYLKEEIGVLIASAECKRVDGGVLLTWCTMDCGGYATFDVYRGFEPSFSSTQKRNDAPVYSSRVYEFLDRCEDPTKDAYYYIVERAAADPTRYGPLLVKGEPLAAIASLGQNYPNPFNPSTTIPFTIGATGAGKPVNISFYNVSGRLVDSYVLGVKGTGNHSFRWNPALGKGGSFPSGVYYCRLRIDKEIYTRTLILLR